jgi:hypothetical protein
MHTKESRYSSAKRPLFHSSGTVLECAKQRRERKCARCMLVREPEAIGGKDRGAPPNSLQTTLLCGEALFLGARDT